jgi:hypothetical protein
MSARFTRPLHLLATLVLLAACYGTGYAQILYGSITGNVKDPSGGAIAGASVQVANPSTGLQRQTTTNNDGNYSVGDCLPGLTTSQSAVRRSRT